jgi:hypothetical protein
MSFESNFSSSKKNKMHLEIDSQNRQMLRAVFGDFVRGIVKH